MAQEPKRKHSKSRKRTRRAAIMLKKIALITCPNCKQTTLPHISCFHCGYYKSKQVQEIQKVTITKA